MAAVAHAVVRERHDDGPALGPEALVVEHVARIGHQLRLLGALALRLGEGRGHVRDALVDLVAERLDAAGLAVELRLRVGGARLRGGF